MIGRNDDFFQFINRRGEKTIVYADYIRRSIISSNNSIQEYTAIQKKNGTIHLEIDSPSPGETIETALHRNLNALFDSYQIPRQDIRIIFKYIHFDPENKRKRTIRE